MSDLAWIPHSPDRHIQESVMMEVLAARSPPGKVMALRPTAHDREPRHEMEEQAAIQSGKIAEAARRSFLWRLTRSFRGATELMSSSSAN